jgi:oxygen-independent coproporphyrinogen-3 oxidase
VRNRAKTRFLYRDLLWTGADMMGLGVASFSHVGGTHYQNEHDWEPYIAKVHEGTLPIYRALTPTPEELMIREFILQMKLGHVQRHYFQHKFGVDLHQRFAGSLKGLAERGFARLDADSFRLNREGLLQVDRLLHEFFLPQHRNARYS